MNLQDTFNKGNQNYGSKEFSNTQVNIIQLQEKMDEMKKVPIKMTPGLLEEIKRGARDANKFLASANGMDYTRYISRRIADDRKMYPRNKQLDSARTELMLTFEGGWRAGLRFLVVECARSPERQKKLAKKGASQVTKSQHNYNPARACDFVPIDKKGKALWEGLHQYAYSIGLLRGIAASLKMVKGWEVSFRSGRDWNCTSTVTAPTTLADFAHIALRDDAKGCPEDEKIFMTGQDV